MTSDLPRKLGLLDGALLLVGSVIGSGIFVVPSLIARRVPEPGLVVVIWIASGLLVLAGALALAELGAMLPQSGGLYVYMGIAMISTLFAYDGWHFVGFVAGEMKDPQRNAPRAILIGVFIVIVIYVAANVAYIFALGQPGIAASDRVASDAVSAMIGPTGASVIAFAILCSTFGAIAANILAGPRVLFAIARDGLVFPRLADIHPRHQSPANAIWLLSLWAGVLPSRAAMST